MKQTRLIMGMPITVEITDLAVEQKDLEAIFSYFQYVDEKFSTYKETSEITKINQHKLSEADYSHDMKLVFDLCNETKNLTNGYFDILNPQGIHDPSGLVKGWSIFNAANILKEKGFTSFYIEAGGDIQAHGQKSGKNWKVGIRNPFNNNEIIKVLNISEEGVATSGTYIRGQHIYNPLDKKAALNDIVSFTVIGPNIYEADRFATAAFAMGKKGIDFIEQLKGFEGYMVDKDGIATMTSNFNKYILS